MMSDTSSTTRIATLCKIRDLQRCIAAFEQQFEKEYGIGLNEGMVLCSLSKSERLSSGELGELLGLSASNISKVIASVEKKGLVERFMGQTDKRQMYFSLSETGRERITSISCQDMSWPEDLQPFLDKPTPTRP